MNTNVAAGEIRWDHVEWNVCPLHCASFLRGIHRSVGSYFFSCLILGYSYCNGLFSFPCNLRRFQRISPWKRSFPEPEMTAALLPSASTMPSSAGNFLRGLSNRLMIPFWRIHKMGCWITVWGQHSRNSIQKDAGSSHWSLRLCFSSFFQNLGDVFLPVA